MLEKTIEVSLLFDFYGKLLTKKQQQVFELYYLHDLSLSEIADKLHISRQGVYDHLHRGEELLYKYENKLGLVTRYNEFKTELNQLNQYISEKLKELDENNENNYHNLQTGIENRIESIKNHL